MTTRKMEPKKRMEKRIEKYTLEYVGGYRSLIFLAILSSIVVFTMAWFGLPENRAWEIAKSIITTDGVILGFIILGVTIFYSGRGHLASRMGEIFEKHFEDFAEQLRLAEISNYEKSKKRLDSSIESAVSEILVIPKSIPACMKFLAFSIGSAFILFGVSDAHQSVESVFFGALWFSIVFLMYGIYFAYKFIEEFIYIASKSEMVKALEKIAKSFQEKGMVVERKEKE